MKSEINVEKESLRMQLSEANQRSRMYAQRFWQLPFAYIAVVGVALANASKSYPAFVLLGAITLCIMGVLIFCIMVGTFRAIDKSVGVIIETESKLGLPISVKKHHWAIDLPNFALVVIGIVICIIAVFMVRLPAEESTLRDTKLGNHSISSSDIGQYLQSSGNNKALIPPNKRVQGTA